MKRITIKTISYLLISLFSIPTFAVDYINVHVQTKEKKAACLGFTVGGTRSGSLGKSHKGTGPINKEYIFGYRTSAFGSDIKCGTKVLTHDTKVTLVFDENGCSISVD